VGFRPTEKRKGKRSASGPHTMTTAVGYAGPAEKQRARRGSRLPAPTPAARRNHPHTVTTAVGYAGLGPAEK
jgi:hypothetical protein